MDWDDESNNEIWGDDYDSDGDNTHQSSDEFSGYQIVGADGEALEEEFDNSDIDAFSNAAISSNDLSVEESSAISESREAEFDATHSSADPRQGMATAADLQMMRIGHMEPRIQATIQELLKDNLYGGKIGKYEEDNAVAINQFASTIGGDPVEFANRMNIPDGVKPSRAKKDLRIAYSMVGQTAEEYMTRGPGTTLTGNRLNPEKESDDITGMKQAFANINTLAELYIDDRTRENPDLYATRLAGMRESITERLLNGYFGETASDQANSKTILALPNETNMTGIKLTRALSGMGHKLGTGLNRLTHENQFDDIRDGRNAEGHVLFKPGTTQRQEQAYWNSRPDIGASLFPDDIYAEGVNIKGTRKHDLQQAVDLAHETRGILRRQFHQHVDESDGNELRTQGFHTLTDREGRDVDSWNTAALLDLDLDGGPDTAVGGGNVDITGSATAAGRGQSQPTVGAGKQPSIFAPYELTVAWRADIARISGTVGITDSPEHTIDSQGNIVQGYGGKGSEQGGMYGLKGISEHQAFRSFSEMSDDRGRPLYTEEEALDLAGGQSLTMLAEGRADDRQDRIDSFDPSEMTDRELYQYRVQENDPYAQGTDEWFAQRKGKVTASVASSLMSRKGGKGLGYKMAQERLGFGTGFFQNAYMREGNDAESKALLAFQAQNPHLVTEEAFFEENKDMPGLGVSPDARVFNKDGSSDGLLELKWLMPKMMEGARNRYNKQMQFQMLVSGETKTHFFALDRLTGKYVSETVLADPKMQNTMLKEAGVALDWSASVSTPEELVAMRQRIHSTPPKEAGGPANIKAGQAAKYAPLTKQDGTPMTVFNSSSRPSTGGAGVRMPSGGASDSQKLDFMESLSQMNQEQVFKRARTKLGITEEDSQAAADIRDEEAAAINELIEAKNKEAAQADETTTAMQDFNDALKAGLPTLVQMASLYSKGNESAMSEMRVAAAIGITSDQSRGLRNALETGGIAPGSVNSVLMNAGEFSKTVSSEAGLAEKFGNLQYQAGVSNIESIRDTNFGDISQMRGMSSLESIQYIQGIIDQQDTLQGKQFAASMMGSPEMSFLQENTKLDGSGGSIDDKGTYGVYRGRIQYGKAKRGTLETIASKGGERAGFLGELGADTDLSAAQKAVLSAGYVGSEVGNEIYEANAAAPMFISAADKFGKAVDQFRAVILGDEDASKRLNDVFIGEIDPMHETSGKVIRTPIVNLMVENNIDPVSGNSVTKVSDLDGNEIDSNNAQLQ